MVQEVLVRWTTINGAGKVSVFNFNDVTPIADARLALNGFLSTIDAICHSSTSWVIDQSGRRFNTATGALITEWSDPVNYAGTGAISEGSPEADASQALVRWRTEEVVAGRFLRGRTFIPGVAQGAIVAGNLGPTSVTLLTTAGNDFATGGSGPVVWRRPHTSSAADPRPSYGGVQAEVTSASAWSEMAVLRRRRG